MPRHRISGVLVAFVAAAVVACGGTAPSPTVKPAATYDEYFVAVCAAWASLFRAVGNPDTASGSELGDALDQAVAAGDVANADRLADAITLELKVGRANIAIAAGWQPRAPSMTHFDRFFAAAVVMVEAKRAVARHDPNAVDPQAAFEGAGGIDAWYAMIEAARASGGGQASDRQCPNVPVTP